MKNLYIKKSLKKYFMQTLNNGRYNKPYYRRFF